MNQRWRCRRDSYRPVEPIRTTLYDVAEIPDDGTARRFVCEHHYSGTYPAARVRVGLYRLGEMVGVAVFSHPCNDRVLTNVFQGIRILDAVELGRFVLLDEVPGNGETWFLARAFELLRRNGIRGVVSFSDPVARTDVHGRRVFPGHLGIIYRAHNGIYLGRGGGRTLKLLPDGTVFSDRAVQKIRSGSKGWRYASQQLVVHGADPLPAEADRAFRSLWLQQWTGRLTRPLRHPGNLRYAWALDRRVGIPRGWPYPQLTLEECGPPCLLEAGGRHRKLGGGDRRCRRGRGGESDRPHGEFLTCGSRVFAPVPEVFAMGPEGYGLHAGAGHLGSGAGETETGQSNCGSGALKGGLRIHGLPFVPEMFPVGSKLGGDLDGR